MVFELLLIGGYGLVSLIDMFYIFQKEKKLTKEFDYKLQEKDYKKVDTDVNIAFVVAGAIVDRSKYATRILCSLAPFTNLYPLYHIVSKKIAKEHEQILNSLDNTLVLEHLEHYHYIYNEETIEKRKKQLESVSSENNKTEEFVKQNQNDTLEELSKKREMLDEMIYLKNLETVREDDTNKESTLSYQKVKQRKEKPKN